ncbi:MAG: hypothetical protein K0B52_05265 [FCB group bacterium]|nr:hypothetical protein [FCB group bacterium]
MSEVKPTQTPQTSFRIRFRFYIIMIAATSVLLLFIVWLNKAAYLPENIIPAILSLANAVLAYAVSKREQGNRTYQEMMKNIYLWTLSRFLGMAAVILVLILTRTVEALPFIFTFIGFYILHQLIQIGIMKQEIK